MEGNKKNNMAIYDAVRGVPASAVTKIKGGSYGAAGLSDINPQWRIECMTRLFGPVGIGWTWEAVEVTERDGVLFAHVIVKYIDPETGEFSKPIHGYGGTKFGGRDDSDIYKSTMTDAVSNALRYLGVGADVWYSAGKTSEQNQFDTKYSAPQPVSEKEPASQPAAQPAAQQKPAQQPAPKITTITPEQANEIRALISELEWKAMETKYGEGLLFMSESVFDNVIQKIKARKGGH